MEFEARHVYRESSRLTDHPALIHPSRNCQEVPLEKITPFMQSIINEYAIDKIYERCNSL